MVPVSRLAALQQHAAHAGASEPALVQSTTTGSEAFLPHGYCYLWNKPLLVTHVVSDMLIGLSYVVISIALVSLVYRGRREIPFHVLFIAFGLFIVACGVTHFVEVWTLWHPAFWLSGGVKVVTAVASVTTAAVMPVAVPKVLATIRTAALARARELEAARTTALEAQNALLAAQSVELERRNELLHAQATELEHQSAEAQALADRLAEANEELRAALAAAEVARATAESATEAAQAANRAKGEFLAVMSHELRTPLNAIGGYAELIEVGVHGPLTDAQRTALTRIQTSQRHLLGLINEVLNVARLEAGQVRYTLTDVPLEPLLRDAEALVAPQCAAKNITVTSSPCAATETARADAEKLHQVLLNLLSNAVKFTPSGGVVALRCLTADGIARIEVQDSGIGIPADKLEDIFEPFVQLDQRLTRRSEGIGLGLAISRDLARGMGGDLQVTSVVGEGSVFTVTLPAAAPLSTDGAPSAPPPIA